MFVTITRTIALFACTSWLFISLGHNRTIADEPAPTESESAAIDPDVVQQQIELLSARRFQIRQDAEETLWSMGTSIEPSLVAALKDANLETRERIKMIREKFQLGITPETPVDARNWIGTALNSGSEPQRREAVAALAKAGYFVPVVKVLERLDSATQRNAYVSLVMTQTRATKASSKQDDFHFQLLRMAVAEPNPTDGARLIGSVLRASQVRQRTSDKEWIAKFVDLVSNCPVPTAKRSLIENIYFNLHSSNNRIDNELMVRWIDMVADEPDRAIRRRHVSKLLSASMLMSSQNTPALRDDASKFDRALFRIEEVFKQLSPTGKNALLDTASNVPTAMSILHERLGDKPLLVAAANTKDASIRGNLTGRLSALPSWPSDKNAKRDILQLIEAEQDATAEQQIVTGYVQGLVRRSTSVDAPPPEVLESLWEKMTTPDDQAWQLAALVETYASPRFFAEMHGRDTLKKMFRVAKLATATEVQAFAYAPITKKHLCAELKKHHYALQFVQGLDELPLKMNLGSRFSSLLSSSQFTGAFHDVDERRALLTFVKDQSESRTKRYAATGILRNKTFLKQLLAEDQFDYIKLALITNADNNTQSDMLGRFLANEATIDFLSSKGRIKELLEIDDGMSDNGRELVLMQLVGSDAAITALLDAKQYDALLKSIGKVKTDARKQDLIRRLMTRKAYARILAKQGSLTATLIKLSRDKNWMNSRGYLSLISNLKLVDLDNDPQLALSFWDFATQLPRGYNRSECVKSLFASDWFLPQITAIGKLDQFVASVPKTITQAEYHVVIQRMVSQPNAKLFLKEGGLDAFVRLCRPLSEKDRRMNYRSLGYQKVAQDWFSGKGQPQALLKEIQSINVADRGIFATAFLDSGILSKQRQNKQLAPLLVKFTQTQPKSVQPDLALVLLSQYATSRQVTESNPELADLVVTRLRRPEIDFDFFRKAIYPVVITEKLKEQKLLRGVTERCLNWPDAGQRASLVQTLLTNATYLPTVTDAELRAEVKSLLRSQNSNASASLTSTSYLVSRLVKLGMFPELRAFVDTVDTNRGSHHSRQWTFYLHSAVVEKMRAEDPKAKTLVNLFASTTGSSLQSRVTQLAQNRDALRWLLDGQGIDAIEQVIGQTDQRSRSQLVRTLTTSYTVAQNFQRLGYLRQLIELKIVRDTLMSDNSYLTVLTSSVARQDNVAASLLPLLKHGLENEKSVVNKLALQRVLQQKEFQNALINSGEGRWLLENRLQQYEAIQNPKAAEQSIRSTLRRPDGLFSLAVRVGDLDLADKLLMKIADDDAGMLRLIRFRMLCRRFAPEFDRDQLPEFANDDAKLRFTYYRLRSQNQMDAAGEIAKQITDPVIQWTHAIETLDGDRLATLPVPPAKAMPLSPVRVDLHPVHRQVEEIAYKLLGKQLAMQTGPRGPPIGNELDESIAVERDRLLALLKQHPKNDACAQYVADVLLSSGRPSEAMALLDKRLPRRALFWHWERLDFDRALEAIGWQRNRSDELFDKFAGGPNPTDAERKLASDYLLNVALMMKAAGKHDDVRAVINTVRGHGTKYLTAKRREVYLVALASRMNQMGFIQYAHHTFAEFESDKTLRASYFAVAYRSARLQTAWTEAFHWWELFAKQSPEQSAVERLNQVDAVMFAKRPIDSIEEFPGGFSSAELFDRERPQVASKFCPVPATLLKYEKYPAARQALSALTIKQHSHWILMGRSYLAEKNYAEAAKAFQSAWENHSPDLTRLFLAGHCWELAGQSARANRCKLQARVFALVMGYEFGLATGLESEGLQADAIHVHDDLLRTTPPGHKFHVDAIPLSARSRPDVTQRIRLWQEHDLYYLRPTLSHSNLRVWVYHAARRPALKAEWATERDDFAAAEKYWQAMADVSMANTRLVLPLLAKLDAKKQTDLADKIQQAHLTYLQERIEKYPQSAAVQEHLDLLNKARPLVKKQETKP